MKVSENYRITAVRLVEFHNLGTTTVDIPDGGHLFLLGDNGSGKTTLLDAIHLVLSAGRDMEFNSAARVAGAKDAGGRTIQGIVLRYNAVTGRVARETGITYAAVEMRSMSDGNKVVSLAVGLSAEGFDIAYQSWGGMASIPVRDLPLTVEDEGRLRAATQAEFKRALSGGNFVGGKYFGHISEYRETVAKRLFGGESKYADVCKLLRTGKAYREIAARATNYDELFRQLLEDPDRETFEPLLKGLRELEESKGRLEQIDERARYLKDLSRRRDQLANARLKTSVIAWAEAEAARVRAATEVERLESAETVGQSELKALESSAQAARAETERARERLDDLRQKDATGLLGREKSVMARLAECRRRADEETARLLEETAAVHAATKACARASADCSDALRHAGETIQKASREAELSCGELTDALFAANPLHETAVCMQAFAALDPTLGQARDVRMARTYEARQRAADAATVVEAAEKACALLRARQENVPNIPGFADFQAALRQSLLSARSVYELLEPASGCDARHLALLEQLAGEAFLATLVTDEKEADRVRQLAWHEGSGIAVAVREDVSGDVTTLTPWLGNFISFEESDPAAVRLLARQLASNGAPQDGTFLSVKTWAFRDRTAPLPNERPRLIGRKARAAELARQQREAEENLSIARRAQKAAEKDFQIAEASERAVRNLVAVVETERNKIRETVENVRRAREQEATQEALRARTRNVAEERAKEVADVQEELDDLRLRMRAEGIDATLERRLAAADKALRQKDEAVQKIQQQIGVTRGRLETLAKTRQTRETEAATAQARAETAAATFASRLQEGESVADGAARLCPTCVQATDFAALREQCVVDARVAETEIRRMIREQKGEPFSFSFDVEANRLADRRGSSLDEVLADETRRLEELSGAINQKSREVFERIFMGEVMNRLYRDLLQIEDLARRIQRKLAGRHFGSSRYTFELMTIPTYEGFVKQVRNVNSLSSEDDKDELRTTLAEHRDEILNAEIDQIPEILDYRRWFRFQLKVLTENEEGRVIDRKVKSLGSGGEQAVPNYLLILTVAEFLYHGGERTDPPKCAPLLFDEAFYGIDAARRDQLLAFADDLGLQLFVSSPDQDGVKREIRHSVSLIVIKDENLDVHLSPIVWRNVATQSGLFDTPTDSDVGMKVLAETN